MGLRSDTKNYFPFKVIQVLVLVTSYDFIRSAILDFIVLFESQKHSENQAKNCE